MMDDDKRARRLIAKAATIRRNYENKAVGTGGDSAEMNITFGRARTKRLHAQMNAGAKMAEAIRMESEAARLLGKPDPHHVPARTAIEIAKDKMSEAVNLESQALLMEQANLGFGADLYVQTARMRRRAYALRAEASGITGEPIGADPVPFYESDAWMADRLDREADCHDGVGNTGLAASKRAAAAELRLNAKPPLRSKDGAETHVLFR